MSGFPGMRVMMSDEAKGLGEVNIQMILHARRIAHVRCAWHLISKNLKSSTIRVTQAEIDTLYKVVYARTREYAETLLSTLSGNAPLLDLWSMHEQQCATHILLERRVSSGNGNLELKRAGSWNFRVCAKHASS